MRCFWSGSLWNSGRYLLNNAYTTRFHLSVLYDQYTLKQFFRQILFHLNISYVQVAAHDLCSNVHIYGLRNLQFTIQSWKSSMRLGEEDEGSRWETWAGIASENDLGGGPNTTGLRHLESRSTSLQMQAFCMRSCWDSRFIDDIIGFTWEDLYFSSSYDLHKT